MREHYFGALSMGNGDKSQLEVKKLITRLEKAFSTHSGLQQGQGSLPKSILEDGKKEIKDVVLDIATALGVRDPDAKME